MGACKAPIPNLLLTSSSSSSSSSTQKTLIPISRTPLLTRRLVLLSLPLANFLLPSNSSAVDAIESTSAVTTFNPISDAERDASAAISRRISEALDLLERGRDFQARGDFDQALLSFTQVIEKYKEFAFSDYARVGRALTLYEVGNRDDAIAEMEDVSMSLKGYPEVHAALAAALYVDKHAPLLAENQFTIATLLDPHYTDLSYVKDTKHWPPSLVSSLQHFITLS
ncbi:putative tetratricopeptide-like helical domain-containing protein [Rosa chinensis]|uniref:Putative tetratricopeptide-like helical domain-containing protein n=1 Tax=Rosa chinensis TaxID=74649 RepID=A0A2P6RSL9_ROSCH|nr:uncharacterized protein LOC112190028 [Rosa chinensis]PRQ49405.1 putative tetratricopeptide-like helical domain-containing protein [Rosa chinensis]